MDRLCGDADEPVWLDERTTGQAPEAAAAADEDDASEDALAMMMMAFGSGKNDKNGRTQ